MREHLNFRTASNGRRCVAAVFGLVITFVLIFAVASPAKAASPALPDQDLRRDAAVVAVEKVMPSVVNIATETIVEYQDFYQRLFSDFFGQRGFAPRRERQQSI